jgi:hypothetical protein
MRCSKKAAHGNGPRGKPAASGSVYSLTPESITTTHMNSLELRASLGLAGIYALRMLGMFLILPVFAIYAQTLRGADNHTLIGLALGSYGLTQALLQLPLGMLSDRIGRKR